MGGGHGQSVAALGASGRLGHHHFDHRVEFAALWAPAHFARGDAATVLADPLGSCLWHGDDYKAVETLRCNVSTLTPIYCCWKRYLQRSEEHTSELQSP